MEMYKIYHQQPLVLVVHTLKHIHYMEALVVAEAGMAEATQEDQVLVVLEAQVMFILKPIH